MRGGWSGASCRAAGMVSRLAGAVVVLLIVSSCLVTAEAGARAHHFTPDPSPQRAPAVAPSVVPTPDAVPQAASRVATHSSTATGPMSRPSIVVHSTGTGTVHTTATVQSASRVRASGAATVPASHRVTVAHSAHRRRTPAHSASAHRGHASHRATLYSAASLSPTFAPTDSLGAPVAAVHAGRLDHPDGLLLLLSSLAMAGLAVASLALLRRLRGLERRSVR